MSELRYGHVEGPKTGREYPMAANQYFSRRGGKFGYLSAGQLTMCGSTNEVLGWIETPKDDSGKNAWKSVSGDSCFVIYDRDAVFEIPAAEYAASLAASQIGLIFKLVNVGATYATTQKAKVANTNATRPGHVGQLAVLDVDTENKTVRVKMTIDDNQLR